MPERNERLVFWGCFIALITTAFAFITRAFLVNMPDLWPKTFGLDQVQSNELFGAGVWPFAISIILFSLVIDRIGYRAAMVISCLCYTIYGVLALQAYSIVSAEGLQGAALTAARSEAYGRLYAGSVVLGLGNGTVESFINPVVATMFHREKTKWLNILHAGWPGGLVLGGLMTILLGSQVAQDWRVLLYVLAGPAVLYLVVLLGVRFPVNERVAAGASYREMLAELGVVGAAIAGFLVLKQVGMVFQWGEGTVYGCLGAMLLAYGAYCRSVGRPMLILLCLVMMPLAITELGTDGAITGIMEEPLKAWGQNPLWVLIYTSAIMCGLRFFAGPIAHKLSPLGLLAACSALAVVGLYALSLSHSVGMIFLAATLYGVGKTFFWPTTLGVVAEQFPKGGALTLNAIGGIGMLTAGVIGGPLIGAMQERQAQQNLERDVPGIYATISKHDAYFLGEYAAIDPAKRDALPAEQKAQVELTVKQAKQEALANVTVFPLAMFICFGGLLLYFRGRGGYRPVSLGSNPAHG